MAWRESVDFGNVTVEGTLTQTGNVTMAGTLAVTGASTFTGMPTFTAPIKMVTTAHGDLPAANVSTGHLYVCTDGNAGEECWVYSNGTNWICLATGATAATS